MRGCPQVRHTEFPAGPPSPQRAKHPPMWVQGRKGARKLPARDIPGLVSLWGWGQGQNLQALLSPCSLHFLLP